jgi:hypothetical protein
MPSLIQIDSPPWPSMEFALATLRVRVDKLARQLAFRVEAWEEEGLGPARGAALRLPSGRPVLLKELQLPIETGSSSGPDVWVDAADLGAVGVEQLLLEILGALQLSRGDVEWAQEPSAQGQAARQAEWARAYRTAREEGLPLPKFPSADSANDPPAV